MLISLYLNQVLLSLRSPAATSLSFLISGGPSYALLYFPKTQGVYSQPGMTLELLWVLRSSPFPDSSCQRRKGEFDVDRLS